MHWQCQSLLLPIILFTACSGNKALETCSMHVKIKIKFSGLLKQKAQLTVEVSIGRKDLIDESHLDLCT